MIILAQMLGGTHMYKSLFGRYFSIIGTGQVIKKTYKSY